MSNRIPILYSLLTMATLTAVAPILAQTPGIVVFSELMWITETPITIVTCPHLCIHIQS